MNKKKGSGEIIAIRIKLLKGVDSPRGSTWVESSYRRSSSMKISYQSPENVNVNSKVQARRLNQHQEKQQELPILIYIEFYRIIIRIPQPRDWNKRIQVLQESLSTWIVLQWLVAPGENPGKKISRLGGRSPAGSINAFPPALVIHFSLRIRFNLSSTQNWMYSPCSIHPKKSRVGCAWKKESNPALQISSFLPLEHKHNIIVWWLKSYSTNTMNGKSSIIPSFFKTFRLPWYGAGSVKASGLPVI